LLEADPPDGPESGTKAPALDVELPPLVKSCAPERWTSLLTRWQSCDGPSRTILVGAILADLDGSNVAVSALRSMPDRFAVDFDMGPDLGIGLPDRFVDDRVPLIWWAVDDQGNYSLAELVNWSPRNSYVSGTLNFRPPISPGAAWIDLMPTTTNARGVIRIPLGGQELPRGI
jgi:hypothetical protein